MDGTSRCVANAAGSNLASAYGRIILPFQPSFAAILAIGVVPLIAYPHWREVRMFPSWWAGVSRALLILASSTRLISSCCKLSADGRIRSLEGSASVCGMGG